VKEKQFGMLHIPYNVNCGEGIGHSVGKGTSCCGGTKTKYFHQKARPSPRPELWPMKDREKYAYRSMKTIGGVKIQLQAFVILTKDGED
jgi:hypothetical protein